MRAYVLLPGEPHGHPGRLLPALLVGVTLALFERCAYFLGLEAEDDGLLFVGLVLLSELLSLHLKVV